MKRVAVVGAGIGGLTAALLLLRRGWSVTLYEQASSVGGRVVFEQNDRYKIDQGPTIVLLPQMIYEIMEQAGIDRCKIPLLRCDPLYHVHFHNGKTLTKRNNIQVQAAEMETSFPGEGTRLEHFIQEMATLFPQGQASFLNQLFSRKSKLFTPQNIKLMMKMRAYKSLHAAMKQYFCHQDIVNAYALQSLYIGGSPFATPAMYALLSYAEHAYGVWMIKGGYASLPILLQKHFLKKGGRLYLNRAVQRILFEQNRCYGVVTKEGEAHYDAVLFNGDFPHLRTLLGDTSGLLPKIKTYVPSSGCVIIYLGVKRRWSNVLTHQFFLSSCFKTNMEQIFQQKSMPIDPSFYVFNPVALDESAAPEGESVLYFLIPVPSGTRLNWKVEAETLANRVIKIAEGKGFAGLEKAICWKKVRTPLDALHEGLYEGGSFGIAPVFSQLGSFRPHAWPYKHVSGLYAVGASIHPGGGVPIVMQGARLAVAEMIRKEECR